MDTSQDTFTDSEHDTDNAIDVVNPTGEWLFVAGNDCEIS